MVSKKDAGKDKTMTGHKAKELALMVNIEPVQPTPIEQDGAPIASRSAVMADENNDIKLEEAAREGLLERVKELLNEGADPNGSNDTYDTAMHNAIFVHKDTQKRGGQFDLDRMEIIKELLKAGANIEATGKKKDFGQGAQSTALMTAVAQRSPEFVRILIEHHPDVNAKDFLGMTPLIWAARNTRYRFENTKILLDNGADVNATNNIQKTALIFAAMQGAPKVVSLLIQHHADVNAKDHKGVTALMWAAKSLDTSNGFENVKILLDNGADVNAKDGQTSALMSAASNGEPKFVSLLIEHRADVNAKDQKGMTALMHATHNQRYGLENVKILLDNGADVNAKDDQDNTVFDIAYNVTYQRGFSEESVVRRPEGEMKELIELFKSHGAKCKPPPQNASWYQNIKC